MGACFIKSSVLNKIKFVNYYAHKISRQLAVLLPISRSRCLVMVAALLCSISTQHFYAVSKSLSGETNLLFLKKNLPSRTQIVEGGRVGVYTGPAKIHIVHYDVNFKNRFHGTY